jgi:tetratricopeptide (TPR) repeat protein
MRREKLALSFWILVASFGLARCGYAEHPIDVQRLSAEGDYFKALEVYERLPDRRLEKDAHVAAAKSAWALGLVRMAADIFDSVLRSDNLESEERSRITLSRGIIEFQEERYQEAALFAEKTVSLLPEKAPLRGRALLLWGQSLIKANEYSNAEDKLWRAFAEAAPADRADVAMSLGAVQLKLGKLSEAQRTLKTIPTDNPQAAEAIRLLANISMQTEQSSRARFWLEKGRNDYSESFVDSWSDYAQMNIALKDGDLARARKIVDQAQKRLPPSDAWLIVMQASLEQAEWNTRKNIRKDTPTDTKRD